MNIKTVILKDDYNAHGEEWVIQEENFSKISIIERPKDHPTLVRVGETITYGNANQPEIYEVTKVVKNKDELEVSVKPKASTR